MSQSTIEQQKKVAAASAAAQQSDNIAHALSGAGGGVLSMALTCVAAIVSLSFLPVNAQTIDNLQLPPDYPFDESASRIEACPFYHP